ncbi:uncharacterized protein N7477_010235 [Penicillium maclennaniae]|uniref:uncharacterized protein n=1 Tax=Penicillium maclennaniae TaxID=1343394 RepID=UPI002541847A|nr:uncharacterized protein N7477_010235 [Penicillium maclennaniae]KAJ5662619.1 hypothetical protein N7477_010235 [Penicillium maclennaniae]
MPNIKSAPAHSLLCCTTKDFQAAFKEVLPNKCWVYISSSANSGASLRANLNDWSLINFRPRVMRSVNSLNTKYSILDQAGQFPFFVSAMGSLGNAHLGAEPLLREEPHARTFPSTAQRPSLLFEGSRLPDTRVCGSLWTLQHWANEQQIDIYRRKIPSTMASEKRQEMLRPKMTSGRPPNADPFLDPWILD